MLKEGILWLGLMVASLISNAQVATQKTDSTAVYPKLAVYQRTPPPYASLREADVIYGKFIHRVIDSREKKNLVMQWPQNPLSKILFDFVMQGENSASGRLKAYPTDSLIDPLKIGDINKQLNTCETIQKWIGPGPYDY